MLKYCHYLQETTHLILPSSDETTYLILPSSDETTYLILPSSDETTYLILPSSDESFYIHILIIFFSQKQLTRKMNSRLVIIECAGYIFWQLFLW